VAKRIKRKKGNLDGSKDVKRGEKRRVNWVRILIYVVAITMLFSAFHYFTSTPRPSTQIPEMEEPYIDKFSAVQIGDSPILLRVNSRTDNLIALIKSSISYETIKRIYNISLPSLNSVVFRVGNPRINPPYVYETSTFMFFQFDLDSINEDITNKLIDKLESEFGKEGFTLYGECVANLTEDMDILEMDNVHVLCRPDTKDGSYIRAIVFKINRHGIISDVIGFESERIPEGPVVSADVLNITDFLIDGSFISMNFDFIERLSERANISIDYPRFVINSTIENTTFAKLEKLRGVSVEIKENVTMIKYNNSFDEIQSVLTDHEYLILPGKISIMTSVDNVDEALGALNDSGIVNVSLKKVGYVRVPRSVIIDHRIVKINSSDNLRAILSPTTEVNDKINVTLTAIRNGDKTIVLGATQIH